MANYYLSTLYDAIATYSLGGALAGPYTVKGVITLPRQSEGSASASQLVVSIAVNGGTPIYTGAPGADGFQAYANLLLGDVFTITFSSTSAIDQVPNSFKATVELMGLS